jgi:ankyrin repeat protein
LHWAAGSGHVSIVSYLTEKCNFAPDQGQIGKRSFSGRTPLHWAARNGHLTVVHYLIAQCNVDIEAKTLDGTTAFCWAAWQGHLDVMK